MKAYFPLFSTLLPQKMEGNIMKKTNEELDELIGEQENLIPESAGLVDVKRGSVTKSLGQTVKNRREAMEALESRKEITTVNLKAGI
jgi:hypothetical protein